MVGANRQLGAPWSWNGFHVAPMPTEGHPCYDAGRHRCAHEGSGLMVGRFDGSPKVDDRIEHEISRPVHA